jgi:hypothetical protein
LEGVKTVPNWEVSSFQSTENSILGPEEVSSFRRSAIHRFRCTFTELLLIHGKSG